MLGETLLFENGGLFEHFFAALEQGDCQTISCTILDRNDDVILLAAVSCFMRKELTLVNQWVLRSNYSSVFVGGVRKPFPNYWETCQLLTQEIKHTGRNPTGNLSGRPAILPEKQMLPFLWSVSGKQGTELYRTSPDAR